MYHLYEFITAKYVHVMPYGPSSGALKVHVPSLMPDVPMGEPKITPCSLDASCYANAQDCKPAVAKKVSVQNYITADKPYHDYKKPCYWFGTELTVEMKEEDALVCRLSPEHIDNSTEWP